MRVLLLAGGRPDYLQDLVFHGLVAELGAANVVEHPPVPRFHGAAGDAADFPMLHFGVPEPRRGELTDLVAETDAVVIGSLRDDVIASVRELLALRSGRPVAFLDGEDDPYVRGVAGKVDLYFKREKLVSALRLRARMPVRRLHHRRVRPERWSDPLRRQVAVAARGDGRTIPLPLGIVDTGFEPPGGRTHDVAFLGSPTSPERQLVAAQLRRLRAEGLRVELHDEGRRLPWHEYMRVLGASRVAVAVRGLGYDTYRHWEIPFAGAALLAETPRTIVPGNFADGREAAFAPVERIGDAAMRLLSGSTEELAARGRTALLERHTSVHRARTVLDHLASVR